MTRRGGYQGTARDRGRGLSVSKRILETAMRICWVLPLLGYMIGCDAQREGPGTPTDGDLMVVSGGITADSGNARAACPAATGNHAAAAAVLTAMTPCGFSSCHGSDGQAMLTLT